MRWLMWFSMGVAAGCAAGAYWFRGTGLIIMAMVCLLMMHPAIGLRKRWKPLVAVAAVLFGMGLGCGLYFGYDRLYVAPARALDGTAGEIRFRVSDYSWETEYGAAADGTIEIGGKTYKLRLYLDEDYLLSPGDELILTARLRLTDEGGQSEPTFHRTSGILLLGYQQEEAVLVQGAPGGRDFPAVLRNHLKRLISDGFPEDTRGFARALLLGDKTELAYETSLAFRISGISHIVAVSGLHVSILFVLVYALMGKRRMLTGLVGIPLVVLFAAVAGFTPSVTRAALMQIVMMLALMARRDYDPPTALAFAVLVILGMNPLTIASVGFQLSVGSVAGIYLFFGKIREYLTGRLGGLKGKSLSAKLLRGAVSSVSLSLSATVITTPLVAYYYGLVSLVSVIANLLVVPVISIIFYGTMLVCLTGAVIPLLGKIIGGVLSLLIRYVFGITKGLSAIPLAAVYTESIYVVFWLGFVYFLIVGLVLTRPGRIWPGLCCGVMGLCLALLLSWTEPILNDYRVTALDVGQGQSLILQSRRYTFLVDCGGEYDQDAGDKAAEKLLSMGINRVDGLIVTHYDRDHTGGIPCLAERIGIDRIFLPGREDDTGMLAAILEATADSERIWLDEDMEIAFGSCSIRIFAPDPEKSGNESSASVLFHSEKCDTLITGDMSAAGERALLETGLIPDLEVLIVGHHGSGSSTSAELVYRTAPDLAIISVGKDNPYGHPTDAVLYRLRLYGCEIYRTDLMGDIIFRG